MMFSKPQVMTGVIAVIAVALVAFINSQVNVPLIGPYLPGGSKF